MNNAVFGKFLENCRRYKICNLVTKWEGRYGARSLISKPNFHSCSIIGNDIAIIELNKTTVFFNKPIYSGFAILDIAKTYLYDFHYNFIKTTFGPNVKLLYTDTDSLIYQFIRVNIYEVIKKHLDKFDTSDYPLHNVYDIPQANCKTLGIMKDELCGRIMSEFVGLRAKMYAFKTLDEDVVKKTKGVTRNAMRTVSFQDYIDCLLHKIDIFRDQYFINAKNCNVFTMKQNKLVLNAFDDKRKICEDGIHTLPWGYRKL